MGLTIVVHFENRQGLENPHLWWWRDEDEPRVVAAAGHDDYGPIFEIEPSGDVVFRFTFANGAGSDAGREDERYLRDMESRLLAGNLQRPEVWCPSESPWVYLVRPKEVEAESAEEFLRPLPFLDEVYYPVTGGLTGQGANVLADGRVQFGLFHPTAARVYLVGTFNRWTEPEAANEQVIELKRYRGWNNEPNLWLTVQDSPMAGDEYKFLIYGGVPEGEGHFKLKITDPYARRLAGNAAMNNGVIVDPSRYRWRDRGWNIPPVKDLISYELNIPGFTDANIDVREDDRGMTLGTMQLIRDGYFNELGVNVLALMPVTENPKEMGPLTLGYDPIHFFAFERDLGAPDDLRALVDLAHQHGLAVILDKVFNHMASMTLLWQTHLNRPSDVVENHGGFFFSGDTPWGSRIGSEIDEVQNFLIDCCKYWMHEYHVDGFRFDATHTDFTDHGFVIRMIEELRAFRPGAIVVTENLPNQSDLCLDGEHGSSQWNMTFHHKMKAILRQGPYANHLHDDPTDLKPAFYFARDVWARHTHNVINYVWSHDEHSPMHAAKSNAALNNAESLDQIGRLGMLVTMVALGQPMIMMGQEWNQDRPRNVVYMEWLSDARSRAFFEWSSRLIHLRRRHEGLRLAGADPEAEGIVDANKLNAFLLAHFEREASAR
ncbi:MAG: 1,4-alpha-glucan branching protein, partial [Armatimonadetes bacterium]|nr:1,4-alpha-glucan branching protein [Armatimonadota bacterium]